MKTIIFDSSANLFNGAAQKFSRIALSAIADHDAFYLALAGGSTPKGLYELLATPAFREDIPWSKVHVYFGDERCVPLDHQESNYNMASQALLNHVPIPIEQVHPMASNASKMAECADEYARLLISNIPVDGNGSPIFDLILLGMGDDGHTASLFPDTSILKENRKFVAEVYVDKMRTWRLSLTYQTLNAANNIMLMVAGESKAEVIGKVLSQNTTIDFPVQRLKPEGQLIWLLDKPAAAKLPEHWLKNNADYE